MSLLFHELLWIYCLDLFVSNLLLCCNLITWFFSAQMNILYLINLHSCCSPFAMALCVYCPYICVTPHHHGSMHMLPLCICHIPLHIHYLSMLYIHLMLSLLHKPADHILSAVIFLHMPSPCLYFINMLPIHLYTVHHSFYFKNMLSLCLLIQ